MTVTDWGSTLDLSDPVRVALADAFSDPRKAEVQVLLFFVIQSRVKGLG
jgi:hypothetical protein